MTTAVQPLTPDQIAAVKRTFNVVQSTGNPYCRPADTRDYFARQDYEASEHYEERRSESIRFDDLYSEREHKMWADLQHYKLRSEYLEGIVAEACKILGTGSLVDGLRALKDELRDAKSPVPVAEQADKD